MAKSIPEVRIRWANLGWRGAKTSTAIGSRGTLASRPSVVSSGALRISASATYAASYAVRVRRRAQPLSSSTPWPCRTRSRLSRLRNASATRSRRDGSRPLVAPQDVQDLQVDKLGAMQGNLRIVHPVPDLGARPRAQGPVRRRRGCIENDDHAGSAPLPLFPQDVTRRWVKLDRRELGDPREQLFTGGLLERVSDLPQDVVRTSRCRRARRGTSAGGERHRARSGSAASCPCRQHAFMLSTCQRHSSPGITAFRSGG